jgi:hypothetical protein
MNMTVQYNKKGCIHKCIHIELHEASMIMTGFYILNAYISDF